MLSFSFSFRYFIYLFHFALTFVFVPLGVFVFVCKCLLYFILRRILRFTFISVSFRKVFFSTIFNITKEIHCSKQSTKNQIFALYFSCCVFFFFFVIKKRCVRCRNKTLRKKTMRNKIAHKTIEDGKKRKNHTKATKKSHSLNKRCR